MKERYKNLSATPVAISQLTLHIKDKADLLGRRKRNERKISGNPAAISLLTLHIKEREDKVDLLGCGPAQQDSRSGAQFGHVDEAVVISVQEPEETVSEEGLLGRFVNKRYRIIAVLSESVSKSF